MQTIQPSSLTDDELVKQAHYILDTEKVLPLAWQVELLARIEAHPRSFYNIVQRRPI